MNCSVKFIRVVAGSGTWDPVTGQIGGTTVTELGSRAARIQPLRSSVPKEVPGNDTLTQVVLVSIPITPHITFKAGDQMKVLTADRNPDLLRYDYRLKEVL